MDLAWVHLFVLVCKAKNNVCKAYWTHNDVKHRVVNRT